MWTASDYRHLAPARVSRRGCRQARNGAAVPFTKRWTPGGLPIERAGVRAHGRSDGIFRTVASLVGQGPGIPCRQINAREASTHLQRYRGSLSPCPSRGRTGPSRTIYRRTDLQFRPFVLSPLGVCRPRGPRPFPPAFGQLIPLPSICPRYADAVSAVPLPSPWLACCCQAAWALLLLQLAQPAPIVFLFFSHHSVLDTFVDIVCVRTRWREEHTNRPYRRNESLPASSAVIWIPR